MGGGLWQFFQGKDKFSGESLIASKWPKKTNIVLLIAGGIKLLLLCILSTMA